MMNNAQLQGQPFDDRPLPLIRCVLGVACCPSTRLRAPSGSVSRGMLHVAGILVATLVLGATAFAGETAPAPATPAAPAELPANTWTKAAVDEKAALATANVPGAVWTFTDGYSDSAYRSKTGNVIIRTGIHCKAAGLTPGFYTNTTAEWDLATDVVRVLDVANWSGGSYGGANPLPANKEHPTPNPRHTYDGICYVPEEDSMYMLFGAYMRSLRGTPSEEGKALIEAESNNTWRYSFEDKSWTRIDGSPKKLGLPIRSLYETHLTYWPEGRKLLFLDNGGGNGAEFDLEKREWKAAPPANKPGMSVYHARSTWDTKRGLWVFRKGPDVCTYDPKERKFEKLPDCWDLGIPIEERIKNGSADKPAEKRINWKGVCYVAKHDAYLVTGPTGNDTMVYSCAEKKWHSVKGGDVELPNGYCQYNPEMDLVAMSIHLHCFKFRYVPEKPAAPESK